MTCFTIHEQILVIDLRIFYTGVSFDTPRCVGWESIMLPKRLETGGVSGLTRSWSIPPRYVYCMLSDWNTLMLGTIDTAWRLALLTGLTAKLLLNPDPAR